MNQAPARSDVGMIEQPFHGPRARPGKARFDLGDLFGDMDMDRAFPARARICRELGGRDSAQRMRSDADVGAIQRSNDFARSLEKPGIGL